MYEIPPGGGGGSIASSRPKAQTYFFLGRFSFDLSFAVCLMFNGYTIGCKHCLHLENGLESYFNKWKVSNQYLKKVCEQYMLLYQSQCISVFEGL